MTESGYNLHAVVAGFLEKTKSRNVTTEICVRLLQLLRGLLDDKVLCTQQKPFEWRTIEGLVVLGAMSLSGAPSEESRLLNPRLLVYLIVLTH